MHPWNALYAYCCNVSHGRPMMAWNGLRNMLIQSLSQYMQRSKDEFPFYHRAPFFFLHQLFRQLSFFIWDGHYILCKKLIPVKFWLKNFQKILSMIVFRTYRFWVNRIIRNTKQNDQCDSRREVGMAWAFWRGNLWNCLSIQLEFGWNIIWSLIIFIKSL